MTDQRRRTVMDEPINPDMGEGRHQDSLRRLKRRIEGGLPFSREDSTAIGDKFTHASWGLCSGDREQWPEADDHTFPDDFESRGRISPRHAPGACPMDRREGEDIGFGCFYTCRIFTQGPTPTREEAVELVNIRLKSRVETYGEKTTEDDNEPWRKP